MTVFKTCIVILILAMAIGVEAGTSNSYKISTEILDAGGIGGQSSFYRLVGKVRERELKVPVSASFIIGEGFLKCAYFAWVIFAPLVTKVDPSTAENTQPISVTISGANFLSGATAKLSLTGEADIVATNVNVTSTSRIVCVFDITNAKVGYWNLTVTNPDGRAGTLPSAFRITHSAPVVSSITPNKGLNNEIVNITNLSGNYFRAGAAVKLAKAGETDLMAENVVVEASSKITCRFNLTGKAAGLWDVVVTNDDNQAGALAQAFAIEAPVIEVVAPVRSEKNPFNPATGPTKVTYSLSKDADIVVYIFNMRGERVWEYRAPAGSAGGKVGDNEILWDGVTAFKAFAGSGVYFVHVTTIVDGQIKTLSRTKVAVVK